MLCAGHHDPPIAHATATVLPPVQNEPSGHATPASEDTLHALARHATTAQVTPLHSGAPETQRQGTGRNKIYLPVGPHHPVVTHLRSSLRREGNITREHRCRPTCLPILRRSSTPGCTCRPSNCSIRDRRNSLVGTCKPQRRCSSCMWGCSSRWCHRTRPRTRSRLRRPYHSSCLLRTAMEPPRRQCNSSQQGTARPTQQRCPQGSRTPQRMCTEPASPPDTESLPCVTRTLPAGPNPPVARSRQRNSCQRYTAALTTHTRK